MQAELTSFAGVLLQLCTVYNDISLGSSVADILPIELIDTRHCFRCLSNSAEGRRCIAGSYLRSNKPTLRPLLGQPAATQKPLAPSFEAVAVFLSELAHRAPCAPVTSASWPTGPSPRSSTDRRRTPVVPPTVVRSYGPAGQVRGLPLLGWVH